MQMLKNAISQHLASKNQEKITVFVLNDLFLHKNWGICAQNKQEVKK